MENKETSTENAISAKPAYIMVQMKVQSLEELNQRYAQFAIPILLKHGGQMIAGSPSPNIKREIGMEIGLLCFNFLVWKLLKVGIILKSINHISNFV